MLNCRACLWRCIQALDTSPSATQRLRRDAPSVLRHGQRRSFQTPSNLIPEYARPARSVRYSGPKTDSWSESPQAANIRMKARKSLTQRRPPAQDSVAPAAFPPRKMGRRDPSVSTTDFNRRKKELQHLTDPLELANFVQKELAKGKDTEMLQLVRMASHSMQSTVAWNHIINHYLLNGRVSVALGVYNDMKKRAQFPDSYTYSIILRGLALNAQHSGSLGKALSVYHSLSAPNSRVQPSIIHTNAMLKVCARSLDMDALWGVAAKIPESGPAAANAITYATILNAIRQSLLVGVPVGESEEEVAKRRDAGVMEGRRVWHDVVMKWKAGSLLLEEKLVCAMGRLLLVGARPRDWDDVLSLVEQTMDIPRLVPRLGSTARLEAGYPELRAPSILEQYRKDDHVSPTGKPIRGEEFLSLVRTGNNGSGASLYTKPSNNTLSMVQEACQKIVAGKAANAYWDLLTDTGTYAIVPDANNLNARLRILRQNRSSAKAVELIKSGFQAKALAPHPGTFRIAMSTCVRDKNNHHSLQHATELLEMMAQTMEDVDPKAVAMYAELAMSFPLGTGSDKVHALTRVYPLASNIRLQLTVGAAAKGDKAGAYPLRGAQRDDALAALRKIYALMDSVVLSDAISEEQKRLFKEERSRLGSFLQRTIFKE
ncbi:hypothetical protein BU24DRAFT_312340, partial [Aaosphaeria arxii CBS 175.79]